MTAKQIKFYNDLKLKSRVNHKRLFSERLQRSILRFLGPSLSVLSGNKDCPKQHVWQTIVMKNLLNVIFTPWLLFEGIHIKTCTIVKDIGFHAARDFRDRLCCLC